MNKRNFTKNHIAAAAGMLACLLCLPATALEKPPAASVERFAAADEAFLRRADRERAREALRLYREIYRRFPQNPDAAWRLSMACYFVGFNVAKDAEERKKLFAEGRDAGLAAARHAPAASEGHFWAAVNMALYGQTVGVVKMLFTLNTVRDHLRTSLAADPGYAYGGAHRILGKIDESLPGVLGGSTERARAHYENAIANAPDEPLNYLFLATILLERCRERENAVGVARRGLAVRPPEPYRFESLDALRQLRKFVEAHAAKE